MTAKGLYIYGIVPNFYGTTQFQTLENSGVYAISFRNVSAIVSNRDSTEVNFSDRESLAYLLVHHQETIEELQRKGFTMILPMRLGTIVTSTDEVLKILTCGHDLIIDALKKIEYLTEIDLVVTWGDFPGLLQDISAHPEINALKLELLQKNSDLTKVDQVKVGMLIKERLDAENKDVELKVLDVLSPYGLDIKMHEVMNDEMIVNSAFLINRNKREKFEHAIDMLDEKYQGVLNFKLIGPLPCYSFYTLEVVALDADKVDQARKALGVREKISEQEIKRAYLEKAKQFHPDNNLGSSDTENFNIILEAYHSLLDYAASVRQSIKDEVISLAKEDIAENLILVKIKD